MTQRDFGPLELVIEAEEARGNAVRRMDSERELHGETPWASFRYPMDRAAIEAEFDLGWRFLWAEAPASPTALRDTTTELRLFDGAERRGWLARRRLAGWWNDWERHPRSRRPLEPGPPGG